VVSLRLSELRYLTLKILKPLITMAFNQKRVLAQIFAAYESKILNLTAQLATAEQQLAIRTDALLEAQSNDETAAAEITRLEGERDRAQLRADELSALVSELGTKLEVESGEDADVDALLGAKATELGIDPANWQPGEEIVDGGLVDEG
jgi:chromosome segregation ATPase